ncbi:uncharacterized protein LOC126778588 [Nymphalis io]|uniref:uncharacterized protein LOC126776047 n=1 Tax=Inachis io TaxID=171585 RepID=UPI0021684947|nr:uncharacterized protein LOC126776047 [Nymphalis io]XP_050357749.1 uncharacterized protein LOC126778295 [Nymphalis io]XP_050358223.1 uncharacterized protein LOC126778588 [Nymphalis io]
MASDEETLLLLLLRHRRRQRKRKTRSVWVEEILMYREQEGDFYTLYPRLRRSEKNFFNYFRMSIASFDELTSILKLSISRQDTVMRKSIPAEQRLAMTLRMCCSGVRIKAITMFLHRTPFCNWLLYKPTKTASMRHSRQALSPVDGSRGRLPAAAVEVLTAAVDALTTVVDRWRRLPSTGGDGCRSQLAVRL